MQPRPQRCLSSRHLIRGASVGEALAFPQPWEQLPLLVTTSPEPSWLGCSWSSPSTWPAHIFPLSESLTGSSLGFTSAAFRMKRLMVNRCHRPSRPDHRNAGPGSAPEFRRAELFPPPVFAVGFIRRANRCGIQSYQPGRFREIFQVLNFN